MHLEDMREIEQTVLIGVDWGTSRFRRLLIGEQGQILHLAESDQGFARIAHDEATQLILALTTDFPDKPILMGGMVGSTLGLQEVDYADCPLTTKQMALHIEQYKATDQISIVPGVRWCGTHQLDVMRGEELQVFGWISQQAELRQSARLCLPGTHSKWVEVQGEQIINLETVLTGELFKLLTEHSVLVSGEQVPNDQAFCRGVNRAKETRGIMRQLFSTRAEVVAGEADPAHGRSYLSGLLIGNELLELAQAHRETHVIGDVELIKHYSRAAEVLALPCQVWDGCEMAAYGLHQLWSHM